MPWRVFRQVKEKCIYLAALSPPSLSHEQQKRAERKRVGRDVCGTRRDSKEFFGLPEGTKMGLHLLLFLLLFVCMEEMERERNWMDPIQSSRLYYIPLFFFSSFFSEEEPHKAFSVRLHFLIDISLLFDKEKKSHPTLSSHTRTKPKCLSLPFGFQCSHDVGIYV